MGQLVYGVVGAAVGFYFGGPTGASLGWAIGSGVGAVVTAEDIIGPRLQDLKVQSSTYGLPISLVYGTARTSGNVIWSTDLIEHENKDSAKGGQSIVSYSYTVSCAVALCEGEIAGVQKIWANNELIYDVSVENTGPTGQGVLVPYGLKLAIPLADASHQRITIYTGSETQTADPRMQAELGAANVPAYRGLAYVVFEDLPLEKFGNRVPNFNFQVVKNGAETRPDASILTSTLPSANVGVYDKYSDLLAYIGSDAHTIRFFHVGMNKHVGALTMPNYVDNLIPENQGQFWAISVSQYYPSYIIAFDGMSIIREVSKLGTGDRFFGCLNPLSMEMVLASANLGTNVSVFTNKSLWVNYSTVTSVYGAWGSCISTDDGFTVLSNGDKICVLDPSYAVVLDYQCSPSSPEYTNNKLSAYDPARNLIYVISPNNSKLYVVDYINGLVTDYSVYVGNYIHYHLQTDLIISIEYGSDPTYKIFDPDNLPNVFDSFNPRTATFFHDYLTGFPVEIDGWSESIVVIGTVAGVVRVPFFKRLASTATPLSGIVEDQCVRAGLLAADVDVTNLTDSVDGYVITQQASARSNVEPLQIGYFFDAVESDDVLKFVKRGGSSVISIPETDIGAYEYGTDMPPLLEQTRTQETELPRQISVNYLNLGAEHQQGTQYDRRLTGSANIETTLSLPLALSNDSAARIAAVNLYAAWANRNRVKFKTALEYSRYEPTDVVTVDKGNTAQTLRIVKKDEGGNGIIEWEAVSEDNSVYSQAVAGAAPLSMPTQAISTPVYTRLELLDIPLLRDADDGAGCYYAACGYRTGWDGMVLYKSADGGASWAQIAALTHESVIGSSTTVLGSFSGGYVVDELNWVTVWLSNAGLTLSGVSMANLLSGSNACLIGDEVMGFRDATLNADGSYTLTGLLRGLRGTEWAISTHAAGERFVMFSTTATRHLALDSSEIGLARVYRGVSIYTTLEQTIKKDFTNTAIGLKPYAPVQLGGGRDASGNLTVNWVRCTRIGGDWRDYVDASQPEASLAYEVEVWDATYTTLKRTITGIASETTSYTSAQQVTDFGSNQATVYLRVYQLSATVGRGYKLEGTV